MIFLTHTILIAICMSIAASDSRCRETICYCEDYGSLLYQCPKGKKPSVEIRVENELDMHMSCTEKTTIIDDILPKNIFAPSKLTVENCWISNATIFNLNMTNAKYLVLEDSVLGEDNLLYSSDTKFDKLEHFIIKNTEISFRNMNIPMLINLEIMELNSQSVSGLLNDFNHIKILKMEKIKLVTLGNEIFRNINNLTELQLEYNSIETLSDEVFKTLENLKILNLGNNNIKYMGRPVLIPLVKLEQIHMDFNEGLKLDEYMFSNLTELTEVHLRSCGLTIVPENIFSGSLNITEIYLQSNNISNIPEGLFKGLRNLKVLDLSDNTIKSLDGIFEDSENLQRLDLSYNELKKLEANDFKKLINLKNLILSYNKIESIDGRTFAFNGFLEKIDLSHNEYHYEVSPGKIMVKSPFSKCLNLRYLDLSFNYMKDIPDDIPVVLRNLEYWNLEGNQIEMLDLENIRVWAEDFDNVKINLRYNNISHFAKSKMIDPDYILEYNPTERGHIELLISQNPVSCDCHAQNLKNFAQEEPRVIQDIAELICSSPPNLKNLKFVNVPESSLTCNLLENDEEQCTNKEDCSCFWRPFDETLIVNCSSCNLTTAPLLNISADMNVSRIEVHLEDNLLTEFPQMEEYENVTGLFLSRNKLLNVSWVPTKIEGFDVSHNNLKTMTRSVLETLKSKTVKNITMGYNPWLCDCGNYYMKEFIAGNIKKIDAEHIYCHNSGLMLHSISEKDVCFENNLYVTIVASLFVTLLIVFLIISVLYYKYKQNVKIWLYSRNLCIGLLEEEDLDADKKFDVFVSYSQKDEDFVENHLVPLMEDDPYHYKLCIHKRDWVPGSFISENIANSVASSKRTLIVLTPNFLRSEWGKMEFRIAHMLAMKEKRNRVILLIKEDVFNENLDEELKSYIATNTYIEWGDPWFWKRLCYALPRVQQREVSSNSEPELRVEDVEGNII